MDIPLEVESIADTLEKAIEGLRKCRGIVERILGNSPEEVKETLRAMEGMTPSQIRDALETNKGLRHKGLRP